MKLGRKPKSYKMNILFLNSLGKNKWGGGEKWMLNAGKGLAAKGHRVIVACAPESVIEQRSIEAGLRIWSYNIPADIAFWKIPSLKLFLLNRNIDVLICCQNKDVKIGAKAAREVGIKAIFARQGIQNLTNKKKYIRPFTQYIDGIITNTKSIKDKYESYGWFPENFIHVIYNGVEIHDDIESIDLRKKYTLPKNSKIVFSAGRLDHQKGFDLLIEVAKKAKEQHLNWQILIAGEGKLRESLKALSAKTKVKDMIHFIGFSNQVPSLLMSADVFVMPSRYEGMPNALLEAMAAGKANVATAVNGAPELVENGVTGFLVKTESSNEIFDRLRQILSDKDLRMSMSLASLEKVKQQFTNEKMVENLEKLFINQIEKSNASSSNKA
jgi:glycosyltransferase involved in cell wall biosynthesis